MRHRALVTGASGFIGHHLVRRLIDEGWDVTAFIRYTSQGNRGLLELLPSAYSSAYQAFYGDLRDNDAVRKAMVNCDTVFHLGALIGIPYSYLHPREVVDVNVGGTLNVLQAARDQDTPPKVIITSTSEVYGTAQTIPIQEAHPLNAQSPYAATKIAADQLALSYHRAFGLPVCVCRPFNTFGPGQSERAITLVILLQALRGRRVELGSLAPTRDLNYVDNTVDAFLAMALSERATGQVIHFGSNREISIGDLAKKILGALGRSDTEVLSVPERTRPERSEVQRLIGSYDLAQQILGWKPRIDLDEGLARTIEWTKHYQQYYRMRGYAI